MGKHQTYPFHSVKEWACNLQKRQDQEDKGLLRRARAGTTGMDRLERVEQILLLFGLVVGATGLLKNRFLNQFSDFALQMRWCGREGPLNEDYKRHQRRKVYKLDLLPQLGVTDRKFFADGDLSLQALLCQYLYIYLALLI